MKHTRIILPEAIELLLKKRCMEDDSYKTNLEEKEAMLLVINRFFRGKLNSIEEKIFLKLRQPLKPDMYIRAFGKIRKSSPGCSIELAIALCVYIHNDSIYLHDFFSKYGISIPPNFIAQRNPDFEEISVFEEASLIQRGTTNDYLAKKLLKNSKGKHPGNSNDLDTSYHSLVKKLKAYYKRHKQFGNISLVGTADVEQQFKISDFFIDISYIDRAELISNNDFFAIEKEGFSYKRSKKTRNEIFTNYFSVEVVTEQLIFRDRQIILMGNPGVGKTTYARWLCNSWALESLKMTITPIYIVCRELASTNGNSLVSYINEVYFHGHPDQVHNFLRSDEFQYVLILDGYDEASSEQRSLIERDLNRLGEMGSYPAFALLTRPYALIDSPFKRTLSLYELIGFNDINLIKYVSGFFEKVGKADQVEPFLELVSSFELLKDLAHNPLSLSYIASIYCSDNGDEILKQIKSSYDLNKEALTFIINYHTEQKKMDRADFLSKLDECTPFIAELEINLSFVYRQKGPLDKNYKYAQALSKMGIGRVEHNRNNGEWSFYILNVHYQEILATEFYGPKLSAHSILHLLDNPLYWHFSKLLIGYLVSNKREHVIIEILDLIRKGLTESADNFYRYFVILSELPEDILNSVVKAKDIDTLIHLYESIYEDSLWSNLYFESVISIYKNLNKEFKLTFEKCVILRIGTDVLIPERIAKNGLSIREIEKLAFPGYLSSIIEKLGLFNSQNISEAIIALYLRVDQLNQKYSRWVKSAIKRDVYGKLEDIASEQIKDCGYSLLILLYQIEDSELLKSHSENLWNAYEKSDSHAALIIKIIALFTSSKEFIDRFIKLSNSERDLIAVQTLMCVGMTAAFDQSHYTPVVEECLVKMRSLFERWLDNSQRQNEYYRPDYSTYAMALSLTNNLKLFPLLVWANCYEGGAYNCMHNISFNECTEVFEAFFAKSLHTSPNMLDFEELHSTVGSLSIGSLVLGSYYKMFFKFLNEYVQTHDKELNELSKLKTSDGFLDSTIAYELYNCGNTLYYPSSIKKLLDDIYNTPSLMENAFIRFHFVPFLMSCSVPLYEKKYHNFILTELFNGAEDVNIFIHLFHENQVIYWHKSNLNFLSLFWIKFYPLINVQTKKEFWEDKLSSILSIAYRSIKLSFDSKNPEVSNSMILVIAELMQSNKVKKYIYNNQVFYDESTLTNLAIYPLLALCTGSPTFILDVKFERMFNQLDKKRKANFLSEVAQLCNFDSSRLRDYLTINILNQLTEYCHIFSKNSHSDASKLFKFALAN